MNDNRNKLLKKLQMCDFILLEASLYLDAHPNNAMALEYFNKHNNMRKEILEEYVEKYGPISKSNSKNQNTWEWVQNPWPWENTEECE